MRRKILCTIVGFLAVLFNVSTIIQNQPMVAHAQQDCSWCDDVGGIFNPPPVEFNPTYHGYGSTGQVVYNKLDLQTGETMYIGNAKLYDSQGNFVATAKESGLGYYDETKDGGLIAGSLSYVEIDEEAVLMTYAWSVNIEEGGRTSGWVDVDALTPRDDIVNILSETQDAKYELYEDAHLHDNYEPFMVQEAYLPDYMAEYYLDPDRDASKTQGKAKYYYTREGRISGLINIPETGSQRFGVAHDTIPVGAPFYRDMNVDMVEVLIHPPSSSVPEDHSLLLIWGYSETSAGDKIYSWINYRALAELEDSPTMTSTLTNTPTNTPEAPTSTPVPTLTSTPVPPIATPITVETPVINGQTPNCDGVLSLIDVVLMKQYDARRIQGMTDCAMPQNNEAIYLPACDINQDGICGLLDAVIIQQCNTSLFNQYCD